MHTIQATNNGKACLSITMCHIRNYWTDFDKIWYSRPDHMRGEFNVGPHGPSISSALQEDQIEHWTLLSKSARRTRQWNSVPNMAPHSATCPATYAGRTVVRYRASLPPLHLTSPANRISGWLQRLQPRAIPPTRRGHWHENTLKIHLFGRKDAAWFIVHCTGKPKCTNHCSVQQVCRKRNTVLRILFGIYLTPVEVMRANSMKQSP